MGLLKKLQAANPDLGVPEGLESGNDPSLFEGSAELTKPISLTDEQISIENERRLSAAAALPDWRSDGPIPDQGLTALPKLEDMLRNHPWDYASSADEFFRQRGAASLLAIQSQLEVCRLQGVLDSAGKLWAAYSPAHHPLPSALSRMTLQGGNPVNDAAFGAPTAAARAPGTTAAAGKSTRQISGTIIGHGEAPYEFDPTNQPNYFVHLQKPGGKRIHVWGVDLERALKDGGVDTGDHVELDNLGKQPVIVKTPVKDTTGAIVGMEERTVHRNAWSAAKSPRPADSQTTAEPSSGGPSPRSAKTRRPDGAVPPDGDRQSLQPPSVGAGTAMIGGAQSDVFSKVLSAPFVIAAAAGSLLIGGLKYAGEKARGFYVQGRENGHVVLARQLDDVAGNITRTANSMKAQGMGDLIRDMKATGRPMGELFRGMTTGGPYQSFGERFSGLMSQAGFAKDYASLQSSLADFEAKARRYARTGVDLNMDHSDAIERNVEKVSAATEGFINKKGEALTHLQELVREISEAVNAMVQRLLGRLRPQP